MARTKTPTPLYAVLGAGDLVAERLRTTAAAVDTDPKHLQTQVQSAAQQQLDTLVAELRGLPDRAQAVATEAFGQAVTVYGDLAARGETLVTRVRSQQSTQDAAVAAKTTKAQAKATVTTARKQTEQAAKATSTTATKQADKVAEQVDKTARDADKTADQAAAGVKATRTTAKRTTKKATNATKPRAKATRTSARKTVEATTRAATDAAAKVGD